MVVEYVVSMVRYIHGMKVMFVSVIPRVNRAQKTLNVLKKSSIVIGQTLPLMSLLPQGLA